MFVNQELNTFYLKSNTKNKYIFNRNNFTQVGFLGYYCQFNLQLKQWKQQIWQPYKYNQGQKACWLNGLKHKTKNDVWPQSFCLVWSENMLQKPVNKLNTLTALFQYEYYSNLLFIIQIHTNDKAKLTHLQLSYLIMCSYETQYLNSSDLHVWNKNMSWSVRFYRKSKYHGGKKKMKFSSALAWHVHILSSVYLLASVLKAFEPRLSFFVCFCFR